MDSALVIWIAIIVVLVAVLLWFARTARRAERARGKGAHKMRKAEANEARAEELTAPARREHLSIEEKLEAATRLREESDQARDAAVQQQRQAGRLDSDDPA